jgi:hypothetical protein
VSEEVRRTLDAFLERIRGVTCFPERMKVYAPTCHGACLPAVERLVDRISRVAGGATVYEGEGYWIDDRGNLVREPVKVIEVGHNCFSREELAKVVSAIADYAVEAKQDSIAVYGANFYIAPRDALLEAYRRLVEEKPTLPP